MLRRAHTYIKGGEQTFAAVAIRLVQIAENRRSLHSFRTSRTVINSPRPDAATAQISATVLPTISSCRYVPTTLFMDTAMLRIPFMIPFLFVAAISAQAQGLDLYVGGEAAYTHQVHDFGGYNTQGDFSNEDQVVDSGSVVRLAVGASDVFTLAGRGVSAELEYAMFGDETVTSASFPGRPSPTFFYSTDVTAYSFGVMGWVDLYANDAMTLEGGGGLGAMYYDVSTTDGVVAGSADGTVAYGSLGLRAVFPVGDGFDFTAGLRVTQSAVVSIPLDAGVSGKLTYGGARGEFSLGIRYNFN